MNFNLKTIAVSAGFAVVGSAALAAPVDLSGWSSEGGNWNLAADNNSVNQTQNTRTPAVFYDGSQNAQGRSLEGTITVNTSFDDDFIGFVLGYDAGEATVGATGSDFWLIDWKQADQSNGKVGLALSKVSGGNTSGDLGSDYWDHAGNVAEVERGVTLGSTGWTTGTSYDFKLTFTSSLIEVFVDNKLEISYDSAQEGGPFNDGSFGFYNFSQQDVTYAGLQEDILPPSAVPVPASLPLLLGALGFGGWVSRRKKAAA